MSDEELYDNDKIAECLRIIDKYNERIESNTNKYPEEIMGYVRSRMGMDEYDDSKDDKINSMSPDDVFDMVCEWKGFSGYGKTFRSWIEDIYHIKLNSEVDE